MQHVCVCTCVYIMYTNISIQTSHLCSCMYDIEMCTCAVLYVCRHIHISVYMDLYSAPSM